MTDEQITAALADAEVQAVRLRSRTSALSHLRRLRTGQSQEVLLRLNGGVWQATGLSLEAAAHIVNTIERDLLEQLGEERDATT